MPIEINELVIQITNESDANEGASESTENSSVNTESIVQQCVDQVLEVLRQREER